MEQQFQKLEGQLAGLKAVIQPLATTHLRNLAAEVLRHAAGHQDLCTTSAGYFQNMGGLDAEDPRTQDLSSRLNVSATSFVRQADNILSRRHTEAHPGSLEDLDEEVEAAQAMIEGMPSLRAACEWECLVVEGYAAFKAAYPESFV